MNAPGSRWAACQFCRRERARSRTSVEFGHDQLCELLIGVDPQEAGQEAGGVGGGGLPGGPGGGSQVELVEFDPEVDEQPGGVAADLLVGGAEQGAEDEDRLGAGVAGQP